MWDKSQVHSWLLSGEKHRHTFLHLFKVKFRKDWGKWSFFVEWFWPPTQTHRFMVLLGRIVVIMEGNNNTLSDTDLHLGWPFCLFFFLSCDWVMERCVLYSRRKENVIHSHSNGAFVFPCIHPTVQKKCFGLVGDPMSVPTQCSIAPDNPKLTKKVSKVDCSWT